VTTEEKARKLPHPLSGRARADRCRQDESLRASSPSPSCAARVASSRMENPFLGALLSRSPVRPRVSPPELYSPVPAARASSRSCASTTSSRRGRVADYMLDKVRLFAAIRAVTTRSSSSTTRCSTRLAIGRPCAFSSFSCGPWDVPACAHRQRGVPYVKVHRTRLLRALGPIYALFHPDTASPTADRHSRGYWLPQQFARTSSTPLCNAFAARRAPARRPTPPAAYRLARPVRQPTLPARLGMPRCAERAQYRHSFG
jgi:hypothetical protein